MADGSIGLGLGTIAGILIGGHYNRKSQRTQNTKDREFQEYMYNVQRYNNLDQWNRENAYNSPKQQMQRLKEAGLNPHLVYGKGADNTAGSINSASASTPNQPAPNYDEVGGALGEAFGNMQTAVQTKNIQAQTDNLGEQNKLYVKEGLLKEAQLANTVQNTASSEFQLEQSKELKDSVIQKANLENSLTSAKIDATHISTRYTFDKNEREKIANSANVAKTYEEILKIKATTTKTNAETKAIKETLDAIKSIKNSEAKINAYSATLIDNGISPKDPAYTKYIQEFVRKLYKATTITKPDNKDFSPKKTMKLTPKY